MLENLRVVLVRPRFPENVGAAARACANMGCPNLVLVDPPAYDQDKALPMATVKGKAVLDALRIEPDLPAALADCSLAFATTARTGGWRRGVLPVAQAAGALADALRAGRDAAVVFGPEDRGLSNEETSACTRLLTIPTATQASSLNLAQAVLLVLYECFRQTQDRPGLPAEPPEDRSASLAEQEALFGNIKEALLAIDALQDENTDYWMLPVRRFFGRAGLRRSEFNLLMGVCRQIRWMAGKARKD